MIIHFRNNRDTGIRGKRPYLYRKTPSSSMNKEAYKKEYTLYTGDWFESGSRFAYSLHGTEKSARSFRYMRCWVPDSNIEQVFVSKKTLEAIAREPRWRRVEGIFVSLED